MAKPRSTNIRGAAQRILDHRAVRYLAVGGSAFALDVALLTLLASAFGLDIRIATAVSFLVGLVFVYTAQRVFTFESSAVPGSSMVRYLALVALNTVVVTLLVWWMTNSGIPILMSKFLTSGLTTVSNYFLYKHWVYRDTVMDESPLSDRSSSLSVVAVSRGQGNTSDCGGVSWVVLGCRGRWLFGSGSCGCQAC